MLKTPKFPGLTLRTHHLGGARQITNILRLEPLRLEFGKPYLVCRFTML